MFVWRFRWAMRVIVQEAGHIRTDSTRAERAEKEAFDGSFS